MKACFAVESNNGIDSAVYGHFGSAPLFIMVDTDQKTVAPVSNNDAGHAHGACNPMKSIGGQAVDAVVVGGIGAGALRQLNASGIKVFRAVKMTVRENLDLLGRNELPELGMNNTCGGHQGGGGCGHHS
jgi:predicted Fe-Mo cluster-binding NifX family protein